MNYKYVLGVKLHMVNMKKALKKASNFMYDKNQHYITTVNPEIALKTLRDEKYRFIINNADLNLTDGFGLQIASKIFQQKSPTRITGIDFSLKLMEKAEKKKWPIFLLGTKHKSILLAAKTNIQKKFPGIRIAGASLGPYFQTTHDLCLNEQLLDENKRLLSQIRKSKAKILFVAFGAPKQEQWINEYLNDVPNIKIAIGVGGTLDYIAGKVKRAPSILRKHGMEWLYRLFTQPKRITRILKATCVFMAHVVYWRLRMIFFYRPNVVGIFLNAEKKVLLVQTDAEPGSWKFPQGGVEHGESAKEAIIREMHEELGNTLFKIRYNKPNFNSYTWKKGYKGKYGYKGQKQHLFILDYKGKDSDFNFKMTNEISKHKWVAINELTEKISKIRQPVAMRVLKILKKLY